MPVPPPCSGKIQTFQAGLKVVGSVMAFTSVGVCVACGIDIAFLLMRHKPVMDRITFNSSLKVAMETLANLESFVRSAETGGFSAAARRLSLTPAAVSRNVATLERNLGIRLFQRST